MGRLRAWKSGSRVHADFHLVLQRELPLEAAHQEVRELEKVFSDHFGGTSEVLIHLDPCSEPHCPVCNFELCNLRHERSIREKHWNRQTLTSYII